ncbi:MAG: hypothetical protein K2X82_30090, partial [Gemmataceae bacterium]|nr:hypothetical protein [Gemmataceae bacterium]
MSTVLAYQFEIDPHPGGTTRQALAAVLDRVAGWVRGCYGPKASGHLRLPFDGSVLTPGPGHEVRTDRQDGPTHQLVTVDWEFPDGVPPKGGWHLPGASRGKADDRPAGLRGPPVWHFSAVLACDGEAVQVALVVRNGSARGALQGVSSRMAPPNPLLTLRDDLVGELVGRWPCRVGKDYLFPFPYPVGEAVAAEYVRRRPDLAEVFGPPGPGDDTPRYDDPIRELLDSWLASPDRMLPVVVVAEPGELVRAEPGAFEFSNPDLVRQGPPGGLTLPEYLHARLVGHAQVAVLDRAGADRLGELVGVGRGLPRPGVRIYWPGFTADSPPAHHPVFDAARLRRKGDPAAMTVEGSLAHELSYLSGDCYREGRVIQAARAALVADRARAARAAADL